MVQFLIGPLSLLTLPQVSGDTAHMTGVFLVSILVTIALCLLIWREIRRGEARIGAVVTAMPVVVLLMGAGRHMYREAAVDDHRTAAATKTEAFRTASAAARARLPVVAE